MCNNAAMLELAGGALWERAGLGHPPGMLNADGYAMLMGLLMRLHPTASHCDLNTSSGAPDLY